MQKHYFSKKGFSLMLALILAFVLTTLGFAISSLAILQMNKTGGEMNDRQVYLNAKSAVEYAKDCIKNGTLTLNNGYNYFGINTQDGYFSNLNTAFQTFTNEADAKTYADAKDSTYLVITKNGTEIKIKAEGIYGKYTLEDQSIDDLTYTLKSSTPVKAGANNFLMVGQQSRYTLNSDNNYSLLKQYTTNDDGVVIQYVTHEVQKNNFTLSFYPRIFTRAAFIDSNDYRTPIYAYDNGIFFMGNDRLKNDFNSYFGAVQINNEVYGADIKAPLIVFGDDIYGRTNSGDTSKLYVSNLDASSSTISQTYVYFAKDVTVYKYNNGDSSRTSIKTFSKGYYFIQGDLFSPASLIGESNTPMSEDSIPDNIRKMNYANFTDGINYLDEDFCKNSHSAQEGGSGIIGKISWLYSNGAWSNNTDAKEGEPCADPTQTIINQRSNYKVYMAPKPNNSLGNKEYNYYANEINFLWYNTAPLTISSGATLNFIANNNVFSFGADAEPTYTGSKDSTNNTFKYEISNPDVSSLKSSNILKQEDSTAHFNLFPYYLNNSTTHTNIGTVTFINDVSVQQQNGNNYTIKAGTYELDFTKFSGGVTKDTGLDLFSDVAKNYFSNIGGGGGTYS